MTSRTLNRRAGRYLIIEPRTGGGRLHPDLDGRSARQFSALACGPAPCVLCGRPAKWRLVLWPEDAALLPGDMWQAVQSADWWNLQGAVCEAHGEGDAFHPDVLHQITQAIGDAIREGETGPVAAVAHWRKPRRRTRRPARA